MNTYWLSFVDPEKPEGSRFLGVAIIDAENIKQAIVISFITKCNPRGEICFTKLSSKDKKLIKNEHKNKLLSKEMLDEIFLREKKCRKK